MIPIPFVSEFALAAAASCAGIAFGLGYFALLRQTVRLYGTGRHPFAPAALTLGRLVAAALFLAMAAKLGALALLTTFLGFLLARARALREARRAA